MNWVLEHLKLIIAAAGAVAWWLSQRRQASAEEAPPSRETAFDDPALAERTRRIREEIQRKIEQRAKGYATEQPKPPRAAEPAAPPPIVREVVIARSAPEVRRGMSQAEAQRQAEIIEQQTALAEKLREAEVMKTAALKRTAFETATADHSGSARSLTRSTVLDDLHEPAALRRAFILREVLGPPVALR